ncbi:hypothetical protein K1719_003063 [Acacia pycnantha]|nr:hypothetical protein K1719_003063 [Acacia pycnantha]
MQFLIKMKEEEGRFIELVAVGLSVASFMPMGSSTWALRAQDLPGVLTVLSVMLSSSKNFKTLKRKRHLFNHIRGIQTKLEDPAYAFSEFLSNLDLSLREELEEVFLQEELLWIQKSSLYWLCLGDPNTHDYQTKALIHRKRNSISQLKNQEEVWLKDEQKV